jgi:hypothetical protein
MQEQSKYVIQVWDQIGVPCDQRWVRTRDQALGLAKSTAAQNSYTTTVFYEGAVIARYDHRPTTNS